jgi:hypothetical protein
MKSAFVARYMSVLPATTKQNPFAPTNHDAGERTLSQLARTGFWFCQDCNRTTERIESDHGQPARCGHPDCKSTRLKHTASVAL